MFDENGQFQGFDQPNYTGLPNEIFDYWQGVLPGTAFNVLVYIGRWTCGFHRLEAAISKEEMLNGHCSKEGRRLDNGAGVSRRALYGSNNVLTLLESLNCIEKAEHFGPGKKARATRYRIKVIPQSPLAEVFKFDVPLLDDSEEPQDLALNKCEEQSSEIDPALNKCEELSSSQKWRAYKNEINKNKPPEPPSGPQPSLMEPESIDELSGGGEVSFRIKSYLIEDSIVDPEGAYTVEFKEEQARKVEQDIDLGTFQNFYRKGSVVKYFRTRLERHFEAFQSAQNPGEKNVRLAARWLSEGYRKEGNLRDAIRFASAVLKETEEKVLSVVPQAITYTEKLESEGRIQTGTAERMRKEAA